MPNHADRSQNHVKSLAIYGGVGYPYPERSRLAIIAVGPRPARPLGYSSLAVGHLSSIAAAVAASWRSPPSARSPPCAPTRRQWPGQ